MILGEEPAFGLAFRGGFAEIGDAVHQLLFRHQREEAAQRRAREWCRRAYEKISRVANRFLDVEDAYSTCQVRFWEQGIASSSEKIGISSQKADTSSRTRRPLPPWLG